MKKIADRVVSRAVSVRWAHGHVPTQYIEIFVALHPQFQRLCLLCAHPIFGTSLQHCKYNQICTKNELHFDNFCPFLVILTLILQITCNVCENFGESSLKQVNSNFWSNHLTGIIFAAFT